ncbi:hypothetical protein [Spiroplasma endosymbiont of Polydrusus formosus]|uniref:hypothetical protein n=1 Tax=Spiroplasma endosymbiont of Polydrusus formosus TaxID=3139326 RepID=UPI0035B5351B
MINEASVKLQAKNNFSARWFHVLLAPLPVETNFKKQGEVKYRAQLSSTKSLNIFQSKPKL